MSALASEARETGAMHPYSAVNNLHDFNCQLESWDNGSQAEGHDLCCMIRLFDMARAGDYDYEDSQELPAGCLLEYVDKQASDAASPDADVADATSPTQAASPGGHSIHGKGQKATLSAPAPFLNTTFGNHNMASAMRAAMLSSSGSEKQRVVTMLCKPIGAAGDIKWHKSEKLFWSIAPAVVLVVIAVLCVIGHLCNRCRQSQVQS